MSNVILSMMISLDGSIAGQDRDLNWFRTDEAFETEMLNLLRGVDAILLGRVSYQLLADYWPSPGTPSSPEAPGGFTSHERQVAFAGLMNSIPKVVVSIVWGMHDPALAPTYLGRWTDLLPHADVLRIEDAGHWPHEEASERVARRISTFLHQEQ